MFEISFVNPGLIPIEAITTLGVNVKDSDSPIGYFGTGLKYAISVLLRNNQNIIIYRGLEKFEFSSVEKSIRGKNFNIVHMNNEPMGFTTELGKNWKISNAFRELYSNVKDEGGEWFRRRVEPTVNSTTIIVTGRDFYNLDESKIILPTNLKPLVSSNSCEIYSHMDVTAFYRGIAAYSSSRPTLFTYNILQTMTLTEDRTFYSSWDLQNCIGETIMTIKNKDLIKTVITAPPGSFEHDLPFSARVNHSEEFEEVVLRLRKSKDITPGAKYFAKSLTGDVVDFIRATLSNEEKEMMKAAIKAVKDSGIVAADSEINIASSLPGNNLGVYIVSSGEIWISKTAFRQGLIRLTGTILEELIHKETGLDDGRLLQDFILDALANILVRP